MGREVKPELILSLAKRTESNGQAAVLQILLWKLFLPILDTQILISGRDSDSLLSEHFAPQIQVHTGLVLILTCFILTRFLVLFLLLTCCNTCLILSNTLFFY